MNNIMFRKATRHVVDTWLVCHSSAPQGTGCCASDLGSPTQQLPCPTSRTNSGATTPVRKISAHEFERGGLLKPIVNTIDGTPTFLSVSPTTEAPVGGSNNQQGVQGQVRPQRRSRHDLKHLDEKELIFELVRSVFLLFM